MTPKVTIHSFVQYSDARHGNKFSSYILQELSSYILPVRMSFEAKQPGLQPCGEDGKREIERQHSQ
jgi:hypothetical protein